MTTASVEFTYEKSERHWRWVPRVARVLGSGAPRSSTAAIRGTASSGIITPNAT